MSLKKLLERQQKNKEVRKMFTRKAQSTLEYVIILTAIVAAVILASARVGQRVQESLESVADKANQEVNNIPFGND